MAQSENLTTAPPGPNAGSGSSSSWAQIISKSMPADNKNVLEIILQKDEKGPFLVNQEECVKLLRKLGIDTRPGYQMEEIQVCPNGRGSILVTFKKEVPIESFCRYDVIEVTNSGIRAVNVKPVNKREVVISVKNIHPNTKDEVVFDYLNRFGKVVTNKVVYGVYAEGPLKGFRNGNRSYKVELKPAVNLGTYHVIDGHKITVRYPGQLQTCGRCHKTSESCPGRGVARKCEAENGVKVNFGDYILALWNEIGYTPPSNFDFEDDEETANDERDTPAVQQDGGFFSPPKQLTQNRNAFTGICIKTFPKDIEQGQIIDLLIDSGLPETNFDDISFKSNGSVVVKNLLAETCDIMINALHNHRYFGRRVFCNGLVALTPEKETSSRTTNNSLSSTASSHETGSLPVNPPSIEVEAARNITEAPGLTADLGASSLTDLSKNADIEQFVNDHSDNLNGDDLVRRHSGILRSPDKNSIAAEVINASKNQPSLTRAQDLLDELKEMKAKLSEYETCDSADYDTNDEQVEVTNNTEEFQTMNERKRRWRNKRKGSSTPNKEDFLKKPNRQSSPTDRS